MSDVTDYYIGSRIKALRAVRGVSAGKASKALNITRAYLSMIENGKKKPSRKVARKAAEFFGAEEHTFTKPPMLFKALDSAVETFSDEDVAQAFELVMMKRERGEKM